VSTHPYAVHVGGISIVLDNYEVKKIIASGKVHTSKTYKNYLKKTVQKGITYKFGRKGDQFKLGETSIQILHPNSTDYDFNNCSIVL